MPATDTVEIPGSDTAEGKLWRAILAYDDTTSAVVPAGNSGMVMGGSAFSPPPLAVKVRQADVDAGAESSTNTLVGKTAVYSLVRVTAKGRAVCADDLSEKMDEYRYLAVDEHDMARWVLYNLMVYTIALWGSHSNEVISGDLGLLQQKLAGIRADIAGE